MGDRAYPTEYLYSYTMHFTMGHTRRRGTAEGPMDLFPKPSPIFSWPLWQKEPFRLLFALAFSGKDTMHVVLGNVEGKIVWISFLTLSYFIYDYKSDNAPILSKFAYTSHSPPHSASVPSTCAGAFVIHTLRWQGRTWNWFASPDPQSIVSPHRTRPFPSLFPFDRSFLW